MKIINEFLTHMKDNGIRWIKHMFIDSGKYVSAINHIIENKPKFVVEYGGGQSTFLLTELINYLDYGGKVIAYESEEYWYNYSIEKGWNKHNNINFVEVEETTEDGCTGVRYIHPMEDIQGVDFVIIDGPNLRIEYHSNGPNTTFNLKDIVEYVGYEVPFFIDGRSGTVEYYDRLGYTKNIGDIKL